MPNRLFLVWVLLTALSLLSAVQISQEADSIAEILSSRIQTSEPIFISINAGEWTPSLYSSFSQKLLAKGLDIRTRIDQLPVTSEPGLGNAAADSLDLAAYGISSACLIQIALNMKWEQHTGKTFFAYHNERRPVYSFEMKQIKLPEQRLIEISDYDYIRENAPETEVSRLRLRWFEPVVATAAIASMIILLWNFN